MESQAPYGRFRIGDPDVSRRPRSLRRIVIVCEPSAQDLTVLTSEAWALSSHGTRCDRASDIPVATRVHRHASPGFPGAAFPGRASLFRRGWRGSDDARSAKICFPAAS